MNNSIRALVDEVKVGLEAIYGDHLKGAYLYGSYARREEDAESDVDVLVVLDRIDHYATEVDRTSHLVAQVSLKYGISISRVFVSQDDWSAGQTPFLENAREEAIPA